MNLLSDRPSNTVLAIAALSAYVIGISFADGVLLTALQPITLGVILLTLVLPGVLLLGPDPEETPLETVLFGVGISCVLVTALGTTVSLLPRDQLGFAPLSEWTATMVLLATLWFAYLFGVVYYGGFPRWSRYTRPFSQLDSRYLAFCTMVPAMSLTATQMLAQFGTNGLLLAVLAVLSLFPLLGLYVSSEIRDGRPLVVSIALSLILYNSTFGPYLRPTDNMFELYYSRLVIENGIWIFSLPNSVNSMPGIVVWLPTISLGFNMTLTFLYNWVVPIIAVLVPLTAHEIYRSRGYDRTICYFATIALLAMFAYFSHVAVTVKYTFGTLYVAIILYIVLSRDLQTTRTRLLLTVFSCGLITAYYAWTYVLLSVFLLSLPAVVAIRQFEGVHRPTFAAYIAVFLIAVLFYHRHIASGFGFRFLTGFSSHLFESLSLLVRGQLDESYGTDLIQRPLPAYLAILRYIYVGIAGLVALDVLQRLYRIVTRRTIGMYDTLVGLFALLMVAPYLIGALGGFAGSGTIVFFANLLLAPIWVSKLRSIVGRVAAAVTHTNLPAGDTVVAAFLVAFLALNSGFAAEAIWEHNEGPAIYISSERIEESGTLEERDYLDYTYLRQTEVANAEWIHEYRTDREIAYDFNARFKLMMAEGEYIDYIRDAEDISDTYLYLSEFNSETERLKIYEGTDVEGVEVEYLPLNETESHECDKIYSSGGSETQYC